MIDPGQFTSAHHYAVFSFCKHFLMWGDELITMAELWRVRPPTKNTRLVVRTWALCIISHFIDRGSIASWRSLSLPPPAALLLHSTFGSVRIQCCVFGGMSDVRKRGEGEMPGGEGRWCIKAGQPCRPCAFPISLVTATWDSGGFDRRRSPTCSCLTSQKQPSEST